MPCDYSFVQILSVQMDNAILMDKKGAEMIQNIMQKVLGLENARAVYDERDEYVSVDSDNLQIYANRIEGTKTMLARYQRLTVALPRLQALKLQQDIMTELTPLAKDINWLPNGDVVMAF